MNSGNIFILIRHLPTYFDFEKRFITYDSPIDILPVDKTAIRKLGMSLKTFIAKGNCFKIFCANNQRAVSTANVFNQYLNLDIIKSSLLNNISNPEWQNLTESEVLQINPKKFQRWCSSPIGVKFKNGESIGDVGSRVKRFLSELNESCIIVTHTTPFQLILCETLNLSYNSVWLFKPEFYAFTIVYDNTLWALNASELSPITLNYF